MEFFYGDTVTPKLDGRSREHGRGRADGAVATRHENAAMAAGHRRLDFSSDLVAGAAPYVEGSGLLQRLEHRGRRARVGIDDCGQAFIGRRPTVHGRRSCQLRDRRPELGQGAAVR